MPTLSFDGRSVQFTDTGPAAAQGGGPVVALHSGGLSSRQWSKLSTTLSPRHRVLAPDFFGAGGSSAWPQGEPFHFLVDARAVLQLIATLGEPIHLVGHSYGGLVALHVALAQPSLVRSLALFEPVAFSLLLEAGGEDALLYERELSPLRDPSLEGGSEAWLRAFVDWWQGAGAWDGLPQPMRAQFIVTGRKIWLEVTSLMTDRLTRALLQPLAMPSLVLRGEHSPVAERRTCDLLAAALPRGRLSQLDGVGHLAPVTHAAQVNGVIAAFLAEN